MANELIIANSVQVDTIKSSIYEVEKGKGRDEKIDVPVLFAENNVIDKSFYADTFNFLWM